MRGRENISELRTSAWSSSRRSRRGRLRSARPLKASSPEQDHTCALMDDELVDVLGFEHARQARGAETPQHIRYKPGWAGGPRLRAHGEGCVARKFSHLRDPRRRHPQVLGSGGNGQLGYGDTTQRTAPEATAVVNLGSGRTAKAVSAGVLTPARSSTTTPSSAGVITATAGSASVPLMSSSGIQPR